MVCKEELCMWFKNLSPHKRIDFMCGMLHMCLPMELRFMGSFLEDLAKKDFHHLRESEGKANSRQQLTSFHETDPRSFRTNMAVFLALLHSSNRTCSNIIFQMLEENLENAFTVLDSMSENTIHTILLVLSMAMNHPAFSYHQKTQMYKFYRAASEAAESILNKEEPDIIPSLILSESCDMRSCDQVLSPSCSPRVQTHTQYSSHSPIPSQKVHVCKIEVKGSRHRDADKKIVEYRLQVIWSNGERKEVYKTHQELQEFHCKLQQNFPEEQVLHQQSCQLPVLQGSTNHMKESSDQLKVYTNCLSNLPLHILQCQMFESFYESSIQVPPPLTADASTSPRPQTIPDLPSINHLAQSGGMSIMNDDPSLIEVYSDNTYLTQPLVNGDVHGLSPHTGGTGHHQLTSTYSPSCSNKTTSPLISSPCQSPASSLELSPSNSQPPSPGLHDLESSVVTAILEENGLDAYSDTLATYNIEQMHHLRVESLEGLGIPKDKAIAIKHCIDIKYREKTAAVPPNGLIQAPGIMWPPAHSNYLPSLPLYPTHMPPPMYPHPHHMTFPYPQYQSSPPPPPHQGVRDVSPTNSDYSSPSPSPHLPTSLMARQLQHRGQTDSSSDDGVDRDKNPGTHKVNGKWKVHSAPNSTRASRHDKFEDTKHDSNSNSGTPPPLVNDRLDAGILAGNGYASDPTYNAPHRPQILVRPSYKAQPAHTHPGLHPKFIINMPDNSYRLAPQVVPLALPQHSRDGAITTMAGTQNYNMPPVESGQRPMYYLSTGPTVLNRSPFNPMSNARPVYPSGVIPSPANPAMNPSNIVANGSSNSSKVYPPGAGVTAGAVPQIPAPVPTSKSNVTVNGSDISVVNQSQSIASAETEVSRSSAVSAPCTTTVTTSSCSQSSTTKHETCATCGCQALSTQPATNYPPYLPHQMAPQNMWPTHPYTHNTLVHMPVHPQVYLHHPQYHNGLHHNELIFNNPYGLHNSTNHGMHGQNVPNMMYGYNYCNNHSTANTATGYTKKPKKLNCHNCGSTSHESADCNKRTMEAMSGPMLLNYEPKTGSD